MIYNVVLVLGVEHNDSIMCVCVCVCVCVYKQGFPVAQSVKKPLAMQEIWVQSLGWEDPLRRI